MNYSCWLSQSSSSWDEVLVKNTQLLKAPRDEPPLTSQKFKCWNLIFNHQVPKIKFSYRCSHLMIAHPTHQIFNRESQSHFPMEKLFKKSTAGKRTFFLLRGMSYHEMRATITEFYFRKIRLNFRILTGLDLIESTLMVTSTNFQN